jgi:M6 family metalloprotease-like protein
MPMPFFEETFTFTQPDGSPIKVRGTGNQNSASFETLDGLSVVRDRYTGVLSNGRLADDSSMIIPAGPNGYAFLVEEESLAKGLQTLPTGFEKFDRLDNALPSGEMRWEQRRKQKLAAVQSDQTTMLSEGPLMAPPQRHTVGTFVGLTLLIDFCDEPATILSQDVENYCNQPGFNGYSNNGSVFDYFKEVSGDRLFYTNLVAPYYRARQPRSYYTDPKIRFGVRTQELIREAIGYHKAQGFDFSSLTTDDLNYVYAINIFYAGTRINNWSEGLWPHAHFMAPAITLAPGIIAHDYQITDMTAELSLGTFCHENGHLICDFPDLYDYDDSSNGVGAYCLMCAGGSRPNEKNPVHVGAYLKHAAGWTENLTDTQTNTSITLHAGRNDFLIHRKNAAEYYIVENRQRNGRDAGLPSTGLAIWHVDETGNNSNDQGTASQHYECAIMQADGRRDIERNVNQGDTSDLYHAGTASSFSATTNPASNWWNGQPSGLAIRNIGSSGQSILFNIG